MNVHTERRADRRPLIATAFGVVLLVSALVVLPADAAKDVFPRSYVAETAAGFTNTFSTNEVLSPHCPEALAATPGSDPASKVLNPTLNLAGSFLAGGTVHFTYLDNPHTNGGTQNFTIQDCVVTYPAGFFSARDFDPSTGVLINAAYSKAVLVKGGTQIDGASLSGISSSVGNIYYAWKAPADLAADTWVCFFARDIRNNHGGSGNRKVPPTCYQVTGTTTTTSSSTTSSSTTSTTRPTDLTPGIFVGYADELHGVTFTPSPWQGDQGVVYLGCTNGSVECGDLDGGAIRIDNPATNGPLTLVNAFVDVGPCHFHPWDTMLGQSAGPGGTFVLTQTGTLGAPQAPPCDGRVDPTLRPLTNFDTSEGPFDTATPPFSNCDPTRVAAPVITLVFNGFTLTVTDSAKVLTTGGVDRFACVGQDEAAPWTAVASADVVRT